jgi:hypothetical protein
LEKRYLIKDEEGLLLKPLRMFRRVVRYSQLDLQYDKNADIEALQKNFTV